MPRNGCFDCNKKGRQWIWLEKIAFSIVTTGHQRPIIKHLFIWGIFEIVEQVIRYSLAWVSLRLIKSITCSKISNIPYNLNFTRKFNDSSILITIILCDYLNLSLADEHVGDVTIPAQVMEYNQNFLQVD